MKDVSIALVGFGNVGRAFARLLLRKQNELEAQFGWRGRVTGIATGRHGLAMNTAGLDLERALALVESGQSVEMLSSGRPPASVEDMLRSCRADAMLENTPVNVESGEPAVSHLRLALELGMHAITANKGPVVHSYQSLTDLARRQGKRFLFESTVMDGAPIFSLFRATLPAANLSGFTGILNSCTNLILGRMENDETFEEAVMFAQSIGIAETDPSGDTEGWDAAIKVAALTTVLMGIPLKPQQVDRVGISAITPGMIDEARQAGERWKLVCRAQRDGDRVSASVGPERVGPSSPLYSIEGTSSYVQFATDVLPGLGVVEGNPGPETTAYGLLADLINALREP